MDDAIYVSNKANINAFHGLTWHRRNPGHNDGDKKTVYRAFEAINMLFDQVVAIHFSDHYQAGGIATRDSTGGREIHLLLWNSEIHSDGIDDAGAADMEGSVRKVTIQVPEWTTFGYRLARIDSFAGNPNSVISSDCLSFNVQAENVDLIEAELIPNSVLYVEIYRP